MLVNFKVKQIALAGALVCSLLLSVTSQAGHNNSHVDVVVGELSKQGLKGQVVFNNNCAACHGENAAGGLGGPPLIHTIYNPGHHANEAFVRAVKNGVRKHHWNFGNMPPQPQIGFSDLVFLTKFIREVQAQNGIATMQHQM